MLIIAMKRICTYLALLLLAGCAYHPYNMKFGGDTVTDVRAPTTYTYVVSSLGFPYYGPYSSGWYYPVWYSPVQGPHYSWYCPDCAWTDPLYRPVGGMVSYDKPARGVTHPGKLPADSRYAVRQLPPANYKYAVVQPKKRVVYRKPMAYRSDDMKTRWLLKEPTPTSMSRMSSMSSQGRMSGASMGGRSMAPPSSPKAGGRSIH